MRADKLLVATRSGHRIRAALALDAAGVTAMRKGPSLFDQGMRTSNPEHLRGRRLCTDQAAVSSTGSGARHPCRESNMDRGDAALNLTASGSEVLLGCSSDASATVGHSGRKRTTIGASRPTVSARWTLDNVPAERLPTSTTRGFIKLAVIEEG